ncbi:MULTISPECIES: sugar transferase [unclassified Mycolicibacterium]|uniref:sugar transferase n=1 Tax=unclassified Mycolicibacterium TaxID=2636767 RepID=UPI0012DDD358|nr:MULTISPECIES: sugar transferase [unclassified Mycolicibacterium]MUL83996.1 sugar transferase [Mycolicibacterium sp. CBMA 329]MUL89938.1 sugar transferase [Mycolicibacterium sp. CBMA 331]MUL98041.1 sugar transferase [Mycolicibacterium sp. CBMA 334]MUM39453.1 sugar transferase [Mycolicibacterium sp. CBMA 247]MUM46539.1 sugar transferase [Mycolicibacterium sp. CBMA 294]
MQQTEIQARPVDERSTNGNGHPTEVGDTVTIAPKPEPVNGGAAGVILSLIPSQVFERTTWQRRYAAKLRLTDSLVVCIAVVVAQYIRFGTTASAADYVKYFVPGFSVVFIFVWLSVLAGLHTRSPRIIGSGIEEYRRVVAASFWTFGAIAIVTLLVKVDVVRGYLAVALPAGTLGLVLSRLIWRGRVARKRAGGGCQTAVLAIGELDAVQTLANELTRNPVDGYRVVGVGIPGYGPRRGEQIIVNGRTVPIIGGENQALAAIRSCGADTVAIAGTEHFGVKGIRRLIWDLEPLGIDLVVSTGVMDVALARLVMRPIAGLPLLHIEKPQYLGAKRFQKRAFDVCFASAALLGTLPILIATAIAIKVSSRGPVFYCAERIGIDGKPFSMMKFRTMVKDADKQMVSLLSANESDGLLFKVHDDPRITGVGRTLRRFSIDELPQFLNVLRGEMSVVGPRPPLRREVEAYDCDVLRRLLVKPGVTGLWQVSGRSDLSWEKSVRLDLSYVDNWSMIEDVLIIIKTLRAVFRRTGAY